MSETLERDYRETLNLPKTDFPMKADLPKREPGRVAWWREQRTYEQRLERNHSSSPWILHDGPPYANGELHMGHFLNMVLKDIFVKIALIDGKWANFVPGWDMHGLPIELETLKFLGITDFHAIDPLDLRAQCKERAIFWFDRQRETRARMGTFGDAHAYRTINPSFEATIVNALADLAEQGQIYKGLRSTLWCIHDETALAEAEIEYEQHVSPSVYVRFPTTPVQRDALLQQTQSTEGGPPAAASVEDAVAGTATCHPERIEPQRAEPREAHLPFSVLIWTTTPWTLPANAAIALHPEASYGVYRLDDELLLVAERLAENTFAERYPDAELVAHTTGAALEGLAVRHPLFDRDSLIVLADYVDLETGTGAVHTAPGHGADDFETGMKYGLPIINPVDATGRFTAEAGPYAGLQIFDANATIVEDLRQRGMLLRTQEYQHSYPHCWRCHNPVIFRATAQWFISMERNALRERALAAIAMVEYTPEWGRDRQRQMIENHPEWCISRQRTWGTPIPAVICLACDESILDPRVARKAAQRFAEVGADAWWRDPIELYLPDGFSCANCQGTRFAQERNIVDIWFESGVSHLAVLGHDGLPWPSNAVLEGGDQYRGWFRSSLMTGVAIRDAAPYRRVVKNGWVNDEQGRPMSKSRGTGFDANEAMDRWGADVLRLWAASVEFIDDVRFGPNVVEQVGRVYRNIRNRIRFMLGNIGDLPLDEIVPRERMPEVAPLDALACNYAYALFDSIKHAYDDFDIHVAYLKIVEFESEMSSLYFDALKDPLYSRAAGDPRRRSAQSALLYALKGFLAAIAPMLSFTAEEAWQEIPAALRGGAASVFDSSFAAGKAAATRQNAESQTLDEWQTLRKLRAKVAANPELRDFEAKMVLEATPPFLKHWKAFGEESFREALVVSQLEMRVVDAKNADVGDVPEVEVLITAADGKKCRRCWKYRKLGTDPSHPSICSDCAQVVRDLENPSA